MRIISKNHDYYDGVAKQGIDLSIVYMRNQEDIQYQKPSSDFPKLRVSHLYNDDRRSYSFDLKTPMQIKDFMFQKVEVFLKQVIVGFCGNIYPCIKVELRYLSNDTYSSEYQDYCFYSLESLKDFFEETVNINLEKTKGRSGLLSRMDFKDISNFFQNYSNNKLQDLFYTKNVPVFIYRPTINQSHETTLEINGLLKNYQFFKVKDPFSCFQEISMFVSGVLKSNENPMVSISDSDKLHKHGFDKYSFKKLPSKK